MTVTDVRFTSSAVSCRGRLHRPARAGGDVPVVVMAHGLGGTRSMGLDVFAERFAAAGYAALTFDYRHFGESDGMPRQLLSVSRQLADYRAAVEFARSLPGVDGRRVIVWGTSFSGGHAIALSAELTGVAAVVAQCPFTDGPASMLALGLAGILRVAPRAIADDAARLAGRGPVVVATAGRPGTTALMSAPDALDGYLALREGLEELPPNEVAARIGTRIGLYRPGRALRRAHAPTLLLVCDRDSVAPARATLRHARRAAPGVEVRTYPYGHFDIYRGEPFERVVADELDFLVRVAPPSR